jgi:hypothetical protein
MAKVDPNTWHHCGKVGLHFLLLNDVIKQEQTAQLTIITKAMQQ